jgi:hypothetical protein
MLYAHREDIEYVQLIPTQTPGISTPPPTSSP